MGQNMTQRASCITGRKGLHLICACYCHLTTCHKITSRYSHYCCCCVHATVVLPLSPCSFPPEWIKSKRGSRPTGVGRNLELSEHDKMHIRRLYGPPRNVRQDMPEPDIVAMPVDQPPTTTSSKPAM